MKAGILAKITYPTGGYSLFDFEPHKFMLSTGVNEGGGLRIKSIRNYNYDQTLKNETHYAYGQNEDGIGIKLFDERQFFVNYEDIVEDYYIAALGAFCVKYATYWHRRFFGISKYNTINYLGSPVLYGVVTKYEGSPTLNNGKTVSIYNIVQGETNVLPDEFVNGNNFGALNNVWKQANLIEETTFQINGGQYIPVVKKELQYANYNQTSRPGILHKQNKQFIQFNCEFGDPNGPDPSSTNYGNGYFSVYQYSIKTGASRLTKEINTVYNPMNINLSLTTVTDYKYDNLKHCYPTEIRVQGSDNKVLVTKNFYADDVTSTSALGLPTLSTLQYDAVNRLKSFSTTNLNALNKVSEIIQTEKQVQSSGGLILTRQVERTLYKDFGGAKVYPEIQSKLQGTHSSSNPMENRFIFHSYDLHGNPKEVSVVGGQHTSYLWGYLGIYPVAKIDNAESNDFSFSSFETEEKGGWTYSGNPVSSSLSKTGLKYYNLGTGGISKSGIGASTANKLRLTFWVRRASGTGNWTFMGQTESLTTTWKLIEREVTGSTVNITGTGIHVDELRLYPAVAQMTTYTFDPLVGIKTVTDARNYTVHYEYDTFGRLKTVKDENDQIKDHYEYNYQISELNP